MDSIEILPPIGTTGRTLRDEYSFAAARRLGERIVLSGQTGHHPDMTLPASGAEQVEVAFNNAEAILDAAEITWAEVDIVRSYHVIDPGTGAFPEESFEAVLSRIQNWPGGRKVVWSALAVPTLSLPGMLIEIEFEGHVAAA